MSYDARLAGQLEQLLRNWMDDDSAVDVAMWIVTDPDDVIDAAYDAAYPLSPNDGSRA